MPDSTDHETFRPQGQVVLVVVDIQGAFVPGQDAEDEPGLGFMPGRAGRTRRSVDLVDEFRRRDVPVVFIQEVHKPSLVDIGRELDGAEGPHAIEGDPATELVPGLDPRPDEYVVRKRRYSAFHGSALEVVLRRYDARSLVLIGAMTDVCVRYTAVDAHQRDFAFHTVGDLVVGSSQEAHDAALRSMRALRADGVVSSEAVLGWLRAQDATSTGAVLAGAR